MKRRLVVRLLTGIGLGMLLLLLLAPWGKPPSEAPLTLSTNTTAARVPTAPYPASQVFPARTSAQQQLAPPRPDTLNVPTSRARRWSEPVPEPAFAEVRARKTWEAG